jgi:hypothetical protein
MQGNEASNAGDLFLVAGNVTGGEVRIFTGGSQIMCINNAGVGVKVTPTVDLDVAGWIMAGRTRDSSSLTGITDTTTFSNTPYGLLVGNAGAVLDDDNTALNVVSRTNMYFYVNEGTGSAVRAATVDTSGNFTFATYLELNEMSAPGSGSANTARLYAADNGSGKTQLIVVFSSGAAQVLATQP